MATSGWNCPASPITQFKLARLHGEFVWHAHADTDEVFVMLVEPRGVVNTGDAGGAYTAPNDVWI